MKQRQLSRNFVNELLNGQFQTILKLVQEDDTIDMEMRGDSIIIYYRGGKLFELKENGDMSPLDSEYGSTTTAICLEKIETYCQQAKSLIDKYQTKIKCNLGEKEISQRIVLENNYSPYSYDTDYFIVDMEYNDGKQFDLIALKWESTQSAHRTKKCKIALLETKQGISSLRTSITNPGILRHYSDYSDFINSSCIEEFKNDMLMIFKQKCILGLIRGINGENDSLKVDEDTEFKVSSDIEFIAILANYKPASDNLENELDEMDENNNCRYALSSFMGYGLYSKYLLNHNELKKYLNK